MKKMPERMPAYTIEWLDEEPFAVDCEENIGWFIVPKVGEKLNWGLYDFKSGLLENYFEMKAVCKAVVHGEEGVEVETVQTWEGNREERTFVMQLKDGRFIVIDGGMSDPQDRAHLYEYLCSNSPTAKPVIAAWFFTHIHQDHTTTAFYVMEQFSSNLVVESVYYAFQTDESRFSTSSDNTAIQDILPRLNNLPTIYPNIKLIDMNIADQYTIGGVTIDVLIDESGNSALGTGHKDTNSDHNDFSAAIKFTFTSGKTFLVLGDCTETRLKALTEKYDLKCDVMQASHHGLVGGELNAYKEADPDITLYPTKYSTLYNYNYHGILPQYFWKIDYNKWLRENSDCYYCSTDANDTKVRTVVIDMSDLSVSDWSVLPTDWNDELN